MKCDGCGGEGIQRGGPGEGAPCQKCGGSGQMREPARQLVSGAPVPADNSHTALKEDGQQRDYVVLSAEERAKGFLKPVRTSYLHAYPSEMDRKVGCGAQTRMGISIAETFAREPSFYSGTFCVGCGVHRPLKEFTWLPDGEPMDVSLQDEWHAKAAEREAARKQELRQMRIRRITQLRAEIADLERELTVNA